MLKHSLNHYGTTGAPLQSPQHLTNSSHSGDTSMHHMHSHVSDPTRFLEGPPQHNHSHSHSYLDAGYPGMHNSRLFLDTSRISRKGDDHHKGMNGSIYFSPNVNMSPPNLNTTALSTTNQLRDTTHLENTTVNQQTSSVAQPASVTSTVLSNNAVYRHGVLRSLSLLSVLSLLLALNSLMFLIRNTTPNLMVPGSGGMSLEFSSDTGWGILYEVTLSLTALCLSINLCVLLVCSAQYFFAASGSPGSTSFLHKVTVIRGVAIGGFFLSIPLFLCAIILYTFTQLIFSPAVVIASACIGVAIIYGGVSMVYHVYTWQKEKTAKHVLAQGNVSQHSTIELSTLV